MNPAYSSKVLIYFQKVRTFEVKTIYSVSSIRLSSHFSFQSLVGPRVLESMFDDVKRMIKGQFLDQVPKHKHFRCRNTNTSDVKYKALQVLSFGLIVSSTLMNWKGLTVFTDSEYHIVIMLSGR